MRINQKTISNLTLAAMFLPIGFVLPFLTGQVPQIGNMLLPMHIPVFLCALICGWKYGFAIGLILPIMRSLMFGMPPLYPIAISMTFELAAYGLIAGLLYERSRRQNVIVLYRSIVIAMLAGRVVWGAAMAILLSFGDAGFTFQMFAAGAFVTAIPGIILQLVLIPAIMIALNHSGLVRFCISRPLRSNVTSVR